jgi:excinuclease ABC subunit A
MEMDPDLAVPNPTSPSTRARSSRWARSAKGTSWGTDIVRAVARERGIDLNKPWKSMPAAHRKVILYGTGSERVKVPMRGSWGSGSFRMRYEGALTSMMRRMRETQSEEMRQYYQRFLSNRPCSMCGGKRVRPEALGVRVGASTSRRPPPSPWRRPIASSTSWP